MKLFRTILVFFALLPLGSAAQSCFGDFSWMVNGQTVSFNGTVTMNVTSIGWSFGDATFDFSNQVNIQHTYTNAGNYNVCILVADSSQSCMDSTCHNLIVGTGGCQAGFTSIDSMGYVFFFNSSTPGPSGNYFWDFGDSNTSTFYNPSHVYAGPGTYLVCLIAYDSLNNFCDSTCQYVTIAAVGMAEQSNTAIRSLQLSPNPTDGQFSVSYALDAPGEVTVELYDITGRFVAQLSRQESAAGQQLQQFNTESLHSGTYLVRVKAGDQVANTRLVVTHPR